MSTEQTTVEVEPTKEEIDKLIRNHVLGAMGVGLIPLPAVDFIALTGVQLNLLRKLAFKYNTPFLKDKGKSLIGALVGSGLTLPAGYALASFIKVVPVIGLTTGAVAMPATAGATTYAIGKVFMQHFATGGTLLNFDPEKVKAYYEEKFNEGKLYSKTLKTAKA
ncbi:GTPase domain-containing protein [Candidatus Magnetomorum sp. HK-1]|nr:GTPase domain-containing protein [Candidatus Magnetomorum sp. HK-1]